MVLLSVGDAPGNLPGCMRSDRFHGIHLEKRTPTAAAAWREKALGVQNSCAHRPPQPRRRRPGRRLVQSFLPNSLPDYTWPDDVLKLVWEHVRLSLHPKLKPRLFREIHDHIRSRGDFRTVYLYNYEDGDDNRGEFGVSLYCTTCGSRRLVDSVERETGLLPHFDSYDKVTWRLRCESCGEAREGTDYNL